MDIDTSVGEVEISEVFKKMKNKIGLISRSLTLLLVLCLFTSTSYSAKLLLNKHLNGGLCYWNITKINSIRNDSNCAERSKILTLANKITKSELVCVTNKTHTVSGDKHNYESLASYAWPDSTKVNGIPWIKRDGQLNPLTHKYDREKMYSLYNNCVILSLAYYITVNRKYYDLYLQQIKLWFLNKETYMSPQFEYSQIYPGHNGYRGNPQGLIEAYELNGVLESIRLVSSVNSKFQHRIEPKIKKWFKKLGYWWSNSEKGKIVSKANNNHAIAYDELYINIAIFTLNKAMLESGMQLFLKHVREQIEPNTGKQPKELNRTRAYHYSVFNLTHMVEIMIMLNNSGLPVDNETYKLVGNAFAYLRSFKGNQSGFPFKNISNDWTYNTNTLGEDYRRYKRLREINISGKFQSSSFLNSILK